MEKRKLKPILDGEFWMIGDNPNLGELQGLNNKQALRFDIEPQECVDHHIFQSEDGMWHLCGCIRNTVVGRILYHWRSENLTDCNWEKTGEIIRVSRFSRTHKYRTFAISISYPLPIAAILRCHQTYLMFKIATA